MHERGHKFAWMAALGAYSVWGLMPLFWRLFSGTPAFTVFLHRCLWSFPFLFLIALIKRESKVQFVALDLNRLPWLALSGLLIGANWWLYIYGVEAHKVVEMSLGYFFSPLMSAAMGVLFLREKLTRGQWVGVATVVAGVTFYSVGVGYFPAMAVGLALTFSFYGLIRKVIQVPPIIALTTEALVLFVLALFYVSTSTGNDVFGEVWTRYSWLLVFGGVLTAVPLLWFAVAVRGLTMTTLGMLNYISPTGKFLIAVFIFGEIVTSRDLYAFGLIWSGILIYLASTYHRQRMVPQPE